MSNVPYLSLIMTVKNGMPYLADALESVAQQDYKDFELVVQDGQSNDGSLELFQRYANDPRLAQQIKIVSEKDASLADAKERAYRRCQGEVSGSIDADNVLELGALGYVAQYFHNNPTVAALYGAQHMIDVEGNVLSQFYPEEFNLLDHLECRLVPPFGSSFFRKSLVGDAVLPSLDMLYCADFELWLRISHLRIDSTRTILARTRISPKSITCRPETYQQSCADKILAIRKFFQRYPQDNLMVALERRSIAGVLCWAAESVKYSFPSEQGELYFLDFLKQAAQIDPSSPKFKELLKRLNQ